MYTVRLFTHIVLLNLLCFTAGAQTAAPNIETEQLALLGRPEIVQFLVRPVAEALPPDIKGKDISFGWLPDRKFRLIRLFDSSFGDEAISIPWGAKSPRLNYDWPAIETAFEAEAKTKYGPQSAKPGEPPPSDQIKFNKEEIDAAAKAADPDFSDSDFPFYSTTNGCGPDGWKNKLVPEKSHVLEGVDWGSACTQHDRDYMTLGKNRDEADKNFRSNLNKAVDQYLAEIVQQTFDRVTTRIVIDQVPRTLKRIVKVPKRIRFPNPRRPWEWLEQIIEETKEETVTIIENVPREIKETIKDVRAAKRATMLSPARIAEMKAAAEAYYQAVHNVGEPYYKGSQAKQAKYEKWVSEFLQKK